MLTRDQLDALEQSIYDASMAGDVRTGLALLKLFGVGDAAADTEHGIIILPSVDIDTINGDVYAYAQQPPNPSA